jgi:F-type H+-transporting ATPase subunit gamma
MANLKEVRNRITSVNSTMQITSAMKMVSAAKLKRAQDAVTQMRPFSEKLTEVLSNLTSSLDSSESVYGPHGEVKNVLLIPVTSNRGLCGGFNSQIVKATNELIKNKYADKNVNVLSIGKKAADVLVREGYAVKDGSLPEHANHIFDDLTYENVEEIAQKVMDSYVAGQFDEIVLIYNTFKNAATQVVVKEQFLPIVSPENTDSTSSVDYIFEPNKKDILDVIIPKSLKTQVFKAVLDSFAGEQGARMTAMHKATDNASDLLKDLKLTYNKARQTAITTEILEIVSGAEAMNA